VELKSQLGQQSQFVANDALSCARLSATNCLEAGARRSAALQRGILTAQLDRSPTDEVSIRGSLAAI
jgi:hypothetical protein